MQVKGRSGNLGLLAQGGNGYLFIGCILEQFQNTSLIMPLVMRVLRSVFLIVNFGSSIKVLYKILAFVKNCSYPHDVG